MRHGDESDAYVGDSIPTRARAALCVCAPTPSWGDVPRSTLSRLLVHTHAILWRVVGGACVGGEGVIVRVARVHAIRAGTLTAIGPCGTFEPGLRHTTCSSAVVPAPQIVPPYGTTRVSSAEANERVMGCWGGAW